VARPLLHALVGASRFGLLLGLSLWLGLGAALVAQLPLFARPAPAAPGGAAISGELVGAVVRRLERLLFFAMVLVIGGLAARVVLDRAAPPTTLLVPVAGMSISRLLGALAVSPSLRALRGRLADPANAALAPPPPPAAATPAERTAFSRLDSARRLLLTLEVCLALYALYAIA
jgi:hypothetical protein